MVSAGVLGGGYILYKLYDAQRRVADLDRQQRVLDESIKAQLRDISNSFCSSNCVSKNNGVLIGCDFLIDFVE